MVFRDETYRVLLVSAAEKFNTVTCSLLPGSEFHPVEIVKTARAAQRRLLEQEFDLILVITYIIIRDIIICRDINCNPYVLPLNTVYHTKSPGWYIALCHFGNHFIIDFILHSQLPLPRLLQIGQIPPFSSLRKIICKQKRSARSCFTF